MVGFLAIVSVVLIGFNYWQSTDFHRPAEVAGAAPEVKLTLSGAEEIHGTNLISINVAVSNDGGESSPYSGGGPDIRNVLLIDRLSGASRKLLPDNDRRIHETHYFSAEPDRVDSDVNRTASGRDGDPQSPPYEYYALLVKAPKRGGPMDLLVGELRSGKQAWVMRGLDGVDAMWTHSPTQLGFLVRENLILYHRIVDIPTLKVVQSKRIAVD